MAKAQVSATWYTLALWCHGYCFTEYNNELSRLCAQEKADGWEEKR